MEVNNIFITNTNYCNLSTRNYTVMNILWKNVVQAFIQSLMAGPKNFIRQIIRYNGAALLKFKRYSHHVYNKLFIILAAKKKDGKRLLLLSTD